MPHWLLALIFAPFIGSIAGVLIHRLQHSRTVPSSDARCDLHHATGSYRVDPAGPAAMTRTTRQADQHGFGLLEVLIALLIAGLALGSAFRAASESMRASATAERYQEAISRAQSHLSSLSVNLAPGEQEGDDGGGYYWRALTQPIGSTGKRDAGGRAVPSADMLVVTLYAVSVWINWKDGRQARSVQLSTDRLLTSAPH